MRVDTDSDTSTPASGPCEVRTVVSGSTAFLLREHPAAADGSTPVLLLHGVPQTSSTWRDVAPALAGARRVLAPDLPGLGGSTYSGPYDIPAVVGQLAALIEAEVPGGRVDVVGHDWGGSLALGLAGLRPDLVRRLVVVSAPYRKVPLLRAPHVPVFALPVAPELLFRVAGRRVVEAMLSIGWKSAQPLDAERCAEYTAAYCQPAQVTAMLGLYRAAARPRFAALVRRRPGPAAPRIRAEKALVLWGAADPVLPIAVGEGVVSDLGADCVMVTVPGAGHFVVEEATEVVIRVLQDFLADDTTPRQPEAAAPPEKPGKETTPIEAPPAPPPGDVVAPGQV
jgi:pimeloyl-ACP methyl ester carboxylesterase